MQELGAVAFYPCAEADEVDGLEATVDPWVEQILAPLQKALQDIKQEQGAAAAAVLPAVAEAAAEAAGKAASRPTSAVVADAAAAPVEAAVPAPVEAEGANAFQPCEQRCMIQLATCLRQTQQLVCYQSCSHV
jgi:hypothetical protein